MKKIACVAALLTVAYGLTACFALPVEEPVLPPPVIHGAETATYRTIAVSRGDVVYYRDLNASYVSAREESLTFGIGDIYIKAIYVEVGQTVHAGDIVAELDREAIQNELAHAEESYEWTRLTLAQLDEKHALTLTEAGITGVQADEAAYMDERNALLADLESNRILLEYLHYEDERRVMRAGMDGTVTYVMSFTEGDMSQADQRVMQIADQSQSVFMVRGIDTVMLETGDRHDLIVSWEPYEAEVVAPETIGVSRIAEDEAYLIITDDEQPLITSRSYATLHIVLNEVKDVLYIPYTAVRKANARTFAYVLSDGVRTIRDVEIGLEGNTTTEIISGLAEGEMVILD